MRLLLDTHALVWWWTDDPRLPATARAALAHTANTVHVSAVSAWEIATKHRIGKWPDVAALIAEFPGFVRKSRFTPLAISIEHARAAGALDSPHRDPFDRMLAAQAGLEDMILVSADAALRDMGVTVLWD